MLDENTWEPTEARILWTQHGMNFACVCGNYMVISDKPHTCKVCGREYQLETRLMVKRQHYIIIGYYTKKPIGCCWGESAKVDVLGEEPRATFEAIDPALCPVADHAAAPA